MIGQQFLHSCEHIARVFLQESGVTVAVGKAHVLQLTSLGSKQKWSCLLLRFFFFFFDLFLFLFFNFFFNFFNFFFFFTFFVFRLVFLFFNWLDIIVINLVRLFFQR